eukprot:CAMPEP_0174748910 /NCGR_PEP_ID=MMETSP1094-20130205/94536_1 /TAXON_ID=156173 /ORGANISM="Chrysochromulina brevifilum, Strain UTEX LB 985" /LENGTH=42 /DNA_ID= /DNA_START= /DNA_END= /DNA_ORIENTATION=
MSRTHQATPSWSGDRGGDMRTRESPSERKKGWERQLAGDCGM